jgi:hypothetical protein
MERQGMHAEFCWENYGNILENVRSEDGRWEDNIKINLRELGCWDGKWMELAQDHV